MVILQYDSPKILNNFTLLRENMNIYSKFTVGLTLITASNLVLAEDPAWKSQAELGIVNTSGNSKTSTVNAKFDSTLEKDSWRHNVHAEALRTSSSSVLSANKYQASGQSDYKYNETDYAFGRINYEFDQFSGFDYQATLSGGYGKRVMNETDMTLDLEVGPGLRFFKIDPIGLPPLDSDTDPFLRLAAKYSWAVSENAKFTEDLSTEIGSDLTVTKSVTGLQANINTTLAMKITFTVSNSSDVPVGSKKTDTATAVTLVYSF